MALPRVTLNVAAEGHALDGEILTLDLPPGLSIADFKGFVEAETQFPPATQQFYLNGQPVVGDNKTLEEAGISDGDLLALLVRQQPANGALQNQQRQGTMRQQRGRAPNSDDIETTRLRLMGDPTAVARIRQTRPGLADAIMDPARFREEWLRLAREEEDRERERNNQIALLNEDPFNVEAQRKIEELIRQDRVQENLQHAYEHNPEVFGKVTMLYVNVEVNEHPVKAFVDSGAQATIMSPSCAEGCGIMRLIDKRYSGIAKGVGTANILGRVHHAEIKIGDAVLPCSFTVMEGKDVDLLLGLDMLKRYQACIDLKQNKLIFPHGNEVSFLPESEIPRYMEEAVMDEPTFKGPGGTEIGAKTGAVKPAASASSSSTAGPSSGGANGGSFRGQGQVVGNASSAPTQPQQIQPPPGTQRFPSKDIDQLVSLGFSREEAINALNATGGNVEYAAGLLFGGS